MCVCAHQSYVERVAWNEYKMFWNRYIAILNKEKSKRTAKNNADEPLTQLTLSCDSLKIAFVLKLIGSIPSQKVAVYKFHPINKLRRNKRNLRPKRTGKRKLNMSLVTLWDFERILMGI